MKNTKDLIADKYNLDMYELERNFDLACEDEAFKKIVDKLKISKKELIKYTSLIKDSAGEINNCLKCKNIMECKNSVCGFVYYPSIEQDNIVFSYVACKYRRKLDKESEDIVVMTR